MNALDEFDLLAGNAEELGLPGALPPRRRLSTSVGGDQRVSAIEWGGDPLPPVAFLHGGGQNAHTWDSVLLALGERALAIDLPGHGHSDWRADSDYSGSTNATAVAQVIRELAATPVTLVGMSLGGLTAMSLTSRFPELVAALLLVDVSPQSAARFGELSQAQRGSVALLSGPATYDSFDEMLEAAVLASPSRSRSSLRRGLFHNARELPDGRWRWRYDLERKVKPAEMDTRTGWDELSACQVPITLVRGALSGFVAESDVAEMIRRKPDLEVHVVDGAGHSVQSDQPLELVRIIRDFLRKD